jgi:meromycolic acid enoyl-[acyl-carrier-protein] reductase
MLLEGRHLVVTGALTRASIATSVARLAIAQGATCTFTTPARTLKATTHTVRPFAPDADILVVDVTREEEIAAAVRRVGWAQGQVDGLVHSVAYSPPACLTGDFLAAGWDDVATTLQVSAYSLAALVRGFAPLMPPGSSVVALDFDGSRVWPLYNWMGVAKAALACTARYLAAALGERSIRVNLVSSAPLNTFSARGISSVFSYVAEEFGKRAPLGWDPDDAEPTARACVALLSDWFPATTGERVHVDGGFHAVWAAITADDVVAFCEAVAEDNPPVSLPGGPA